MNRKSNIKPVTMSDVHGNFSKGDKELAKAKYQQFKRNQPRMAEDQRNSFIKAIVNSKEVNLPISKIIIN